jgi:MoxR-like ATPase
MAQSSDTTIQAGLRRVAEHLDAEFVGRGEVVRLLLISLLAGEHAVLIGPPGTAKSALLKSLSGLLDARYFEYLLTRFTEPNEIFGPVDIEAYRSGTYRRRTEGMLPEAEVVFLDEIFKSNSVILNSLLSILNDRQFMSGGATIQCPLVSMFGASNEVPSDDSLDALFDRFLLRIRSEYLDAHQFDALLARGHAREIRRVEPRHEAPKLDAEAVHAANREVVSRENFSPAFMGDYKNLVFQIRAEGIRFSDRRAVKFLKLFSASVYLDGRAEPDGADLAVLKHAWNSEDQAPILDELVTPVVEAFYVEHPERRSSRARTGLAALAAEVERIREILVGGKPPGDVQLLSQLRALGQVRAALAGIDGPDARRIEERVTELLEASLRTGRFVDG